MKIQGQANLVVPSQAPVGPIEQAPQVEQPTGQHGHSFGAATQEASAQQGAGEAAHFAQQAGLAPSSSQSVFSLQVAELSGAAPLAPAAPAAQSAPVAQVSAPKPLTEAQKNEQVVREFYAAMEAKDFDKITSLYHPDAVFSDPAFPNISGKKLRNMWKLITGNEGLVVKSSDVKVHDDGRVTGHWDADYELLKGNPIHNSIDSTFEFKDGKIIKHTDSFDFTKWADQALPGVIGKLAGTRVGKFVMQKLILPFAIR